MDTHYDTLTSLEGVQDWLTDADSWVCQFDAKLNISRSQPKRSENASDLDHKCQNSVEPNKNRHVTTQPSSETVKLQEIIVNGLLVKQKRRMKDSFRNKIDFLNIFKGNEDLTDYDYVLLTLGKENGRKHVYKYIRSKI